MGKQRNNPMMNNTTGMVGKTVVFKSYYGDTIVANRPKKSSKKISDARLKIQEKFTVAASYAKQAMLNAATKALYATGIGGTRRTAQSVAMSDFLNAPKVRVIDASEYKGAIGDLILVNAVDDFKVTKVKVTITSAAGVLIESGDAVQGTVDMFTWTYTATAANAVLAGTTIAATAYDTPNNKGVLSQVL
jgi:hypothetical protein